MRVPNQGSVIPLLHFPAQTELTYSKTGHTSPLKAASFTSGGQTSPQKSSSSVSLCTNIGNMSIPFQIICDSYPVKTLH